MNDPFDPDRLRVKKPAKAPVPNPSKGSGAWLPWSLVEGMARQRLSGSAWQVLFLLASTSCRYGGRDVRLSLAEIAERTGLPLRTVKAAVGDLLRQGLIRRPTRCRRLSVTLLS